MKFSILIPTFNRADLLGEAIESALRQSYDDKEIIVVDDGSADQTKSVVRAFPSAVQYVRQENRGKAAALNRGISLSVGEVIVVLDDDDAFPPWTLAKHAAALQAHPSAAFSYGRFQRFYGSAPPAHDKFEEGVPYPQSDPRRLVVKLMENCFIPNPGWAVRRSAQVRVGPYDETLARSQDYDMILRLSRNNQAAFVDDIVFYQRKHEAYRGPDQEKVLAVDAIEKWIKYDRLIFRRLDGDWSLEDFHPFDGNQRRPLDMAFALLQKGVILFRRKVYDGAAQALSAYRSLLGDRSPTLMELKIASGLLGSRYGIDDLTPASASSNEALKLLREGRWPISMRLAMGSQLRWRVRDAIAKRNMGLILQYLYLLQYAFGASTLASLTIRGASFINWADVDLTIR
jgi:glycosyltransferase involved in cell wall biosynthesis